LSPYAEILLLDSLLRLLVLAAANRAKPAKQDAEDYLNHPILTLKELENAKGEKNHAGRRSGQLNGSEGR
jgi:hypothetical protein